MQDRPDPNAEPQDDTPKIPQPPFPIAGIGASAGGIKALQAFFETLPDQVGAAIAVIVHLDPDRHSDLTKLLAVRTRMPVQQVDQRVPLKPDHVYVIPPNRSLLISDQHIAVAEFDEPRGQRAPIDQFFRSMADQHGDGFAIILTGAGADGAVGVKAVKEAGGIILVQDPDEAEYPSMPRAAIAGGHADFVLPVRELATQFVELVQSKEHLKERAPEDGEEEALRRILAHLRIRTGHDFSRYKRATLMRRVARRMQVTRTLSIQEYLAHLREHAEETQALFADLLISVTSFFRDATAFEELARQVIPRIFDHKGDSTEPIRVWVPGCATGEEAYTIAIVLLEEASRREIRPEVQIFATDLDPAALAFAREGRYPSAISADVSDERLRRFFTREEHHFLIRREIRDMIVFAQHSLLKDPPFSRLDLISCRNLLIYLDRELQQQLLNTFHYALGLGGYLFLGSSESAEHVGGLFRAVDRGARIFQSVGHKRGEPAAFPKLLPTLRLPDVTLAQAPGPAVKAAEMVRHHREALNEFAPPSILVDHVQRIVHLSHGAGRYLVHPAGQPTIDATDLVRPELSPDLRAALHRAFEQHQATLTLPVAVEFDGSSHYVALQVAPSKRGDGQPHALVMFLEGGPVQFPLVSVEPGQLSSATEEVVRQLNDELLATRAQLKASRQEFETATENLRAANEELQSINEEYRSTAEELETSKEELQSMNEELQTLNNELKIKLDAVSSAHNDLENLMGATDVGTLFLDAGLRIKRFTPRVRDLFNIKAGDEGRPIADFTRRLDYPNFEREMHEVMEQTKNIEREIRADGQWFLTRMRPYRTTEGRIDGVIATFVDVSDRRRTEEQLRHSLDELRNTRNNRNRKPGKKK